MSDHEHANHGGIDHVVPVTVYLATFAALLVLMLVTVVIAYMPLGYFNLPIALTIAIVKATLIVMFFMEVKYASKLLWVFAGTSFVFLLIMLMLTMNDYATRGWAPTGP